MSMRWQDTALGRAMPQYGIGDGGKSPEPIRAGYGLAPLPAAEGVDWFGDDGVFPEPDKFDAFLALLGLAAIGAGGSVAYAKGDEARRQYQQLAKDYARFITNSNRVPVPADIPEDLIKRINSFIDPKTAAGQALLAAIDDDSYKTTVRAISSKLIEENVYNQVEKAYRAQRILPTKENIDAYNKTLEKFGGKENFKFDVDGDIEGLQPRLNRTLQNVIKSNTDKLAKYSLQEFINRANVYAAGQSAKEAEQIRNDAALTGAKTRRAGQALAALDKEPGRVARVVGGTGRGIISVIDAIKGIGGGGSRLLGK